MGLGERTLGRGFVNTLGGSLIVVVKRLRPMIEQVEIAASVLRRQVSRALAQVQHGGIRFVITWRGTPIAALMSMRQLALLEELERDSDELRDLRHQMQMERFRRAQSLARQQVRGSD